MISLILIKLAGIINAFMDQSSINNLFSKWWNKGEGWKFKWKLDENENRIPQKEKLWYYLWFLTPKWKEKFPFSSTMFVWFTDGWHFLQMLFLLLITFAIVFYQPIWIFENKTWEILMNFLILRVGYSIGFNPTYFILKKRKR